MITSHQHNGSHQDRTKAQRVTSGLIQTYLDRTNHNTSHQVSSKHIRTEPITTFHNKLGPNISGLDQSQQVTSFLFIFFFIFFHLFFLSFFFLFIIYFSLFIFICMFLDPLKHKLFNLVIQLSDYLDKLFKSKLSQVNHIK